MLQRTTVAAIVPKPKKRPPGEKCPGIVKDPTLASAGGQSRSYYAARGSSNTLFTAFFLADGDRFYSYGPIRTRKTFPQVIHREVFQGPDKVCLGGRGSVLAAGRSPCPESAFGTESTGTSRTRRKRCRRGSSWRREQWIDCFKRLSQCRQFFRNALTGVG